MSDKNLAIIRQLLSQELGIPEAKILVTSKIMDDLNADSINIMVIAGAIEERFNVEVPESLLTEMKNLTVGDVAECMDKLNI